MRKSAEEGLQKEQEWTERWRESKARVCDTALSERERERERENARAMSVAGGSKWRRVREPFTSAIDWEERFGSC